MAKSPSLPSSSEMSQEQAQWLFKEAAMLVFLDVPTGTEFGIDYNSWQVGPQFKGVKMIPPGVHFIHYSAEDKHGGQFAPRTSFFHTFKPKEILVKKWDKATEDISLLPVSPEEQLNIEGNIKDLDRNLGVYPYESYKKWVSLTSHVTPTLLDRLQPACGRISSVSQLVSEPSDSASRLATLSHTPPQQVTEAALADMKLVPGTEIRFTQIPRHKYPPGSTPVQVTKYSMDSSYALQCLLDSVYADQHMGVLGEVQFAFVTFLVGQVYEAFEQWKVLVNMLCSCEEAVSEHPEIYSQLISLLHYHVREIPEDFFVDIVAQDNFLVAVLRTLFENLQESSCEEALKSRALKFKEHLEKKFQWDLSVENEDDAPVMVE